MENPNSHSVWRKDNLTDYETMSYFSNQIDETYCYEKMKRGSILKTDGILDNWIIQLI